MKAAGVGLDIYSETMGALARKAPSLVKFATKRAAGAPGLLLDAYDLATAKDKWREGIGLGAGAAGSLVGGAIGSVAGPVGTVAGSVIGGELAEMGAHQIYDHRDDIARYADDVGHDVGRAGLQMMDATFGRGLYPGLRSAASGY